MSPQMRLSGTIAEWRECMNAGGTYNTGSVAMTAENDPLTGTIYYRLPLTIMHLKAYGTAADRRWGLSVPTETIVMTFQAPSMTTVSQASTISRGIHPVVRMRTTTTVVSTQAKCEADEGIARGFTTPTDCTACAADARVFRYLRLVCAHPHTPTLHPSDTPTHTHFAPI